VAQFEFVLKRHGFRGCGKLARASFLGGAALQRCGTRSIFIAPLGAEVALFVPEILFPRTLQPRRKRCKSMRLLPVEGTLDDPLTLKASFRFPLVFFLSAPYFTSFCRKPMICQAK
jgi:hypothetical protein